MTYTTSITPGRYSAEAVTSNLSVYTATVALTRPSNTTAYTAGDVIGAANTTTAANAGNAILTFPNVGGGGGAIRIDSVDLFINNTTVPSGMDAFRLHLYSIPPAAILDNAAFDLTSTEVPRYLGFVTLALPVDIGSTLYSSTVGINKVIRMLPYSETLFGELETRGGYTPASGTLYTVKLNTTDVDEATTGSENLLWAYAGGAVPTLDLEFARTKTLNNQVTSTPPVTFTRASAALLVGSDRSIQTAAVNEPRFDHDPATGESLGLLVEEARTNSLRNNTMVGAVVGTPGTLPTNWNTYSSAGTGVSTSIIGTGVESGVTYVDIRFNGTPSANAVWSVVHENAGAIAAATGQAWTHSAWIKIASGSSSNIGSPAFFFDESTGSTYVTGSSISTSYLTSTWQRYSASYTLAGGATVNRVNAGIRFSVTSGSAIDITLRIGLPQLEQGAFATSVIPTSTATVTRAADVAQITGTNFSQFYNQSEGTLYIESTKTPIPVTTTTTFADLNDGTTNSRSRFWIWSGATSTLRFTPRASNVDQADLTVGTPIQNVSFKAAGSLKVNDFAAALNGGTVSTDGSGTVPFVDRLSIGISGSATEHLGGTIKRLTYWPTRLGNTTLQQITTP